MAKHITILNELKEISPMLLDEAFNRPTYRVPMGYFASLPDSLLNLTLQNATEISGKQGYAVPAGYFEHFAENMLDQVQALELVKEELEFVSPLLQEARLRNPYQVPEGYFETFPEKSLQQRSATLIQGSFRKSLIRFAAAAIITGCIFAAGWIFKNTPIEGSGSAAPLASISFPKQISDLEMQQFLEKDLTGSVTLDTVTITARIAPADSWEDASVNELLADVTDEELANYASSHVTASTFLMNE